MLPELKIDGKQPAERVSGLATNQNQSEALKSLAIDIDFPTTDKCSQLMEIS
jgi:hypothetical protein